VVALAPDHAALVTRDFASRAEAQAYLAKVAVRATDDLIQLGRIPEVPREDLDVEPGMMRAPVRRPDRIHFIETGAPGGKFSAVIPAWAGSRHDVSRVIPAGQTGAGPELGHLGAADILVGLQRLRDSDQLDGPVVIGSSTAYAFGVGMVTPPGSLS
jgi:hypothetical protein